MSRVDLLAEFGFMPPAMERAKQLLDLRNRYRLLTLPGVSFHLAASAFQQDRTVSSARPKLATLVSQECDYVYEKLSSDNPRWKDSNRVADLRDVIHQSWIPPVCVWCVR